MDIAKLRLITKASLMAKGLAKDTDSGLAITPKGYLAAADIWSTFSDDDKVLLALFFVKTLKDYDSD